MVHPTKIDYFVGYVIYMLKNSSFQLDPERHPPISYNANPQLDGSYNENLHNQSRMCSMCAVKVNGKYVLLDELERTEAWKEICDNFEEAKNKVHQILQDKLDEYENSTTIVHTSEHSFQRVISNIKEWLTLF